MAPRRLVSVSRTVRAPASTIFDLLADPRQHARFDGSGSLRGVKDAPARLFLGATFAVDMRIGVPYVTRNVVVDFHEGRTIAWRHFSHCVWRYQLDPTEGATLVTESFNYENRAGLLVAALGFRERNRRSMASTLERLERLATS